MAEKIEYQGYMCGGLVDVDKSNVRYSKATGDWWVEDEGKVYNCHPEVEGVWPIRFEVKSYDVGIYPDVKELFPHIFQ